MAAVKTACVWKAVDFVVAAFLYGWGTVWIPFGLNRLKPLLNLLSHRKVIRHCGPRLPRHQRTLYLHRPSYFRPPCPRLLPIALTRRLLTFLRPRHAVLPSTLSLSYLRSPQWRNPRSPGALVTLPPRLLILSMLPMMKLCTGNRTFSKFPLAELERRLSLSWRVCIEHLPQVQQWNRLLWRQQ